MSDFSAKQLIGLLHGPKAKGVFEVRPAQAQMIADIVSAFQSNQTYICEAETGTGKSLGYLLPAIKWIVDTQEVVVISTNTIPLQEQLLYKDLPLALGRFGDDANKIDVALVKGRNNYLCPRKCGRVQRAQRGALPHLDSRTNWDQFFAWTKTTTTGDFEELPNLSEDFKKQFVRQVCSEADTCKPNLCTHKKRCFYQKAKSKAFQSNLLVVNHHILCADIALKNSQMPKSSGSPNSNASGSGLLPAYDRLIIDEAHHLEQTAMQYFGEETSNNTLEHTFSLLGLPRGENKLHKGLLVELKKASKGFADDPSDEEEVEQLLQDYARRVRKYRKDAKVVFESIHKSLFRAGEKEPECRVRLQETMPRVWTEQYHNPMSSLLYQLKRIERLLALLHQVCSRHAQPIRALLSDLQAYTKRLSHGMGLFLKTQEPYSSEVVVWLNLRRSRSPLLSVHVMPFSISGELAKHLFGPKKTTILTSATLSALGSFDFLKGQLGLHLLAEEEVLERRLRSNFDYGSNCVVFLPKDVGDSKEAQFQESIARYTLEALSFFGGRTLTLFTSHWQLRRVAKSIEAQAKSMGVELLIQGQASRSELLKRFKQNPKSVLMGVNSFWEGIDLQGAVLSCLIMTKLPFSVPTDPIHEARIELLEQQRKNAFYTYTLPGALIRFKQGFGRLIRSKNDKGIFVLLDKRILSRSYGNTFLQALPLCKRIVGTNFKAAASIVFPTPLERDPKVREEVVDKDDHNSPAF